jgi:hypothetical protein
MDVAEQAEAVVDMIPGLTDQDIENTYNEWSKLRYAKGLYGQTEALADFQQIAVKHMLKRLGKWDSFVERVTSRNRGK